MNLVEREIKLEQSSLCTRWSLCRDRLVTLKWCTPSGCTNEVCKLCFTLGYRMKSVVVTDATIQYVILIEIRQWCLNGAIYNCRTRAEEMVKRSLVDSFVLIPAASSLKEHSTDCTHASQFTHNDLDPDVRLKTGYLGISCFFFFFYLSLSMCVLQCWFSILDWDWVHPFNIQFWDYSCAEVLKQNTSIWVYIQQPAALQQERSVDREHDRNRGDVDSAEKWWWETEWWRDGRSEWWIAARPPQPCDGFSSKSCSVLCCGACALHTVPLCPV